MHGQVGLLPDWLSAPLEARPAARGPVIVASPLSYLRRNTIYLVQQHGYDVAAVESREALIREARTLSPSLVLLDATWPDGMGFEACQELRLQTETAGLPVLMFTLNPNGSFHDRAVNAGAFALMRFPGHADELMETVDYALAGLPIENQSVRLTVEGDTRVLNASISAIHGVRTLQVTAARAADQPSSYLYRHASVRFEFDGHDFSQIAWQATVQRVGTRSADVRLVRFLQRQPRRQAVRKDVPLAVELVHPNGLATVARVLNLSVAGMLVANLPGAAQIGDVLDFRLDLQNTKLSLRGVVRRTQEIPNFGYSAGIAFVGLAQETRDALIDFLFSPGK